MNARRLGALLLLVAIVPLLVATFTRGWMTDANDDGTIGFGLLGGEVCQEGQCEDGSWSEALGAARGDARVQAVVYGGYAAIAGTAVLCLALAIVGILGLRRPTGGVVPPLLVLIATLIGLAGAIGTLLVLGKLAARWSHGQLDPGWGYSALLFIGGAALAIIGSVLMMLRPRHMGAMEQPPAA